MNNNYKFNNNNKIQTYRLSIGIISVVVDTRPIKLRTTVHVWTKPNIHYRTLRRMIYTRYDSETAGYVVLFYFYTYYRDTERLACVSSFGGIGSLNTNNT